MPVKVVKRGKKFRIVSAEGGFLERTPSGKPRDGGGHASQSKADAQARALNAAWRKKNGS